MTASFDPYHEWLGIAPKDQPPNHYRLLGVDLFEANSNTIEHAADRQMAHLHTFQAGKHGDLSQRLLNEVAAAKICLLNAQKKAAYDRQLRDKVRPPSGADEPVDSSLDQSYAELMQEVQRPAATRHPATPKPSTTAVGRRSLPVYASAGFGAILLLVLCGWTFWPHAKRAEQTGTLVFDWPKPDRQAVALSVDGHTVVFPAAGPLEVRSLVGKHTIRATRPRFKPMERVAEVAVGERFSIVPAWQPESLLILRWQEADRRDAFLEIDGQPAMSYAQADPKDMRIALVAGRHKVSISRFGFEPFTAEFQTGAGQEHLVVVAWKPVDAREPARAPPSGTAKSTPAHPGPRDAPGKPAPSPNVAGSTEPTPAAPVAPALPKSKYPIPDQATQKAVAAQIDEVYHVGDAQTPQQKVEAAGSLLNASLKHRGSPNELFGMLRRAAELACQGGDASLMLDAAEALAADFAVDGVKVNTALLARFAAEARDAARIKSLADASSRVVDVALEAGQYEAGEGVANQLHQACMRSQGKAFRKQAAELRARIRQAQEGKQAFETARAALAGKPDDPQLNLTVGRWLCLEQNAWEQGLGHLAKSGDQRLHSLAQRDVNATAASAEEQASVADGWWELGQGAENPARKNLLAHAVSWYRRARPGLTSDLAKSHVDSRLEQVDQGQTSAAAAASAPASSAPAKAAKSDQAWEPGRPLSGVALVANPSPIRGLRSWTIESIGHRGSVSAVAYSPDGSLVASGGVDGTVRLWRPGVGLVRVLVGNIGPIGGLGWSPDGAVLASGSFDGTVRLWNPKSGTAVGSFDSGTARVWAVAWSPDGKMLAAGCDGGVLQIWEAASDKPLKALRGHRGAVWTIAWSPESNRVAAVGTGDLSIRMWDVSAGTELRALKGHETPIYCVAWSPDGKTLASLAYGTNKTLILWDVATGESRAILDTPKGWARAVAWSPSGNALATGEYREVVLRDPRSGEPQTRWQTGFGETNGVVWSPQGRELAAAVGEGVVLTWQASSPDRPWKTPANASLSWTPKLTWAPDSRTIAHCIGAHMGLWELPSGQRARTLPPGGTYAVRWAPDGTHIAMGGAYQKANIFDTASGRLVREFSGHDGYVQALDWSPDGLGLASGDEKGTVRIWNPNVGEPQRTFKVPYARFLLWSPDGKTLLTYGEKRTLAICSVASGEIVQTLDPAWSPAAWSPAGDKLVTAGQAQKITIWDGKSAGALRSVDLPPTPETLAWTSDGKTVLAGATSGVSFVDVDSGRVVRSVAPTNGLALPHQILFSPNAQYICCGSPDAVLRVVEVATGQVLRTMVELPDKNWITISEDGHCIGSPGAEKECVYVALTEQGQQTLSPAEFAKKYHWKNDSRKLMPAAKRSTKRSK